MTTVEDPTTTPVAISGARGGPDKPTLRKDNWWVQPVVTVTILMAFVVYATWAAFVNKNYYVGADMHRNLISPFYSPCLTASCVAGSHPSWVITWWHISPALLILIFPLDSASPATTTARPTTGPFGGRPRPVLWPTPTEGLLG